MGAEIGATTSLFPYDDNMAAYLRATDRAAIADAADAVAGDLRADDHVAANPGDYFDQVIEIDLDTLGPLITGPPYPPRDPPTPNLGAHAQHARWPSEHRPTLRRSTPTHHSQPTHTTPTT